MAKPVSSEKPPKKNSKTQRFRTGVFRAKHARFQNVTSKFSWTVAILVEKETNYHFEQRFDLGAKAGVSGAGLLMCGRGARMMPEKPERLEKPQQPEQPEQPEQQQWQPPWSIPAEMPLMQQWEQKQPQRSVWATAVQYMQQSMALEAS